MLELAVVIGLVAFRLARLIGTDVILDGPRHRLFLRFPPKADYYLKAYRMGKGRAATWQIAEKPLRKPSFLGELISCAWCSSVWFAAGITAIVAWRTSVPEPALVWGAACSVAGICATLAA